MIRDNRSESSFDSDPAFRPEPQFEREPPVPRVPTTPAEPAGTRDAAVEITAPNCDADPNHHLWRNGRVWWIAFTFHTRCGRKYRVRKSLATREVSEARVRRDALLARYAAQPTWALSLRFERRCAS